jgi:predicted DNA-binding transcriptional regulator AlpA
MAKAGASKSVCNAILSRFRLMASCSNQFEDWSAKMPTLDKYKLPPAAHFLNEKLAAELIGCSYRTLQGWRLNGIGPAHRKLGPRRIAYVLADIQAWSEANRSSSVPRPQAT